MVVSLDPRVPHALTVGEIAGLWAYLQQVIGQPFRFFRASYAEELMLHLGAELPPASPKLNKPRGSYVLTFRGSAWMIHLGAGPIILSGPAPLPTPPFPMPELPPSGIGRRMTLKELEELPPITPGATLLSADPFQDNFTHGFGLLLGFGDGSLVCLRPNPGEPAAPGDEDLPAIADWELFTPYGLYLRVGPGLQWAYEPSGGGEGRNGAGVQSRGASLRGQVEVAREVNVGGKIVPAHTRIPDDLQRFDTPEARALIQADLETAAKSESPHH